MLQAFFAAVLSLILCMNTVAEVVFDGSMGEAIRMDGPHYNIAEQFGTVEGNNLYHSFSQFNILTKEVAAFSGNESIENVISRVTGGDISIIDGTLKSEMPHANFYFINPAGTIFGEHAKIDVPNSFTVSSADYLEFEDGQRFSAHVNTGNALLSSAAPSEFGFLDNTRGAISFSNTHIKKNTDKERLNINVIGGDINMSGTEMTLTNSHLSLISVQKNATVSVATHTIEKTDATQLGKISISNGTLIQKKGTQDIIIKSGGVLLSEKSIIFGDGVKRSNGNILIDSNNIKIDTGSEIGTAPDSRFEGKSQAGDIIINTDSLEITNGSGLLAINDKQGQSGDIRITATKSILVENTTKGTTGQILNSGVFSQSTGDENARDIIINTHDLTLKKGAVISATTFGKGNGGNIIINATGKISLTDAKEIDGTVVTLGINADAGNNTSHLGAETGDAGTITINAGELEMRDGAVIASGTFTTGAGGSVSLTIQGDLTLSGFIDKNNTGIFAETNTRNGGDAGNIVVSANNIYIRDGARIDSGTKGQGTGGSVSINAQDTVMVSGLNEDKVSAVSASSRTATSGDAGTVNLNAKNLIIKPFARLSTSTEGQGLAGNLNVTVDTLRLEGQQAISSASMGSGSAGSIFVTVNDLAELEGASISTEANLAEGGNIQFSAKRLVDLVNSKVTTSVRGESGNGGNITIDTPVFLILDNSQMVAQAIGGNGGNISIKVENILTSPTSLVSASSERGIDGNINIDSPDTNYSGDVVVLSSNFLDAVALIRESCSAAIRQGRASSFVVVKRQGLPQLPENFQANHSAQTIVDDRINVGKIKNSQSNTVALSPSLVVECNKMHAAI